MPAATRWPAPANFRQHFANGQDFTYSLDHVGHYYADYVRLMTHIDQVLPGRVHRVIYERMVDDTEIEVRACWTIAGSSSSRPASSSTGPSARSGRRAPSRFASRSIATRPTNGAPMSSSRTAEGSGRPIARDLCGLACGLNATPAKQDARRECAGLTIGTAPLSHC